METKDELLSEGEKYFEKVMQDFNQNRKGRNLRKYCNDEGIDYKWLSEYKRTYGATKPLSSQKSSPSDLGFTALDVIEDKLPAEVYGDETISPHHARAGHVPAVKRRAIRNIHL